MTHALNLEWGGSHPPLVTRGDSTAAWRCMDSSTQGRSIIPAPAIYHIRAFGHLEDILNRERIQVGLEERGIHISYKQAVLMLRAIFLVQEIVLGTYNAELDAAVDRRALEIDTSFNLPLKHVVALHREYHGRLKGMKVPVSILYRDPNGLVAVAILGYVREQISLGKMPANTFESPDVLFTNEFIRDVAKTFINELNQWMMHMEYIKTKNVYFESKPDEQKSLIFLNQCLSYLNAVEVPKPEEADLVVKWTAFGDLIMSRYLINKGEIVGAPDMNLAQGILNSSSPHIFYIGEGIMRPLDGGAITYSQNAEGFSTSSWTHFVGCPISWDLGNNVCGTAGSIPFELGYPEFRLGVGYLILSAVSNEWLDPSDYCYTSDVLRASLGHHRKAEFDPKELPLESHNDLKEFYATDANGIIPCYIDIVISPNIKSPSCAQIVGISPNLQYLFKTPKLREKVGHFAMSHLQDVLMVGNPTFNQLSTSMFRWCLSQRQNPSEYEIIAVHPDPYQAYDDLQKRSLSTGRKMEQLSPEEIKFLAQHQPMFFQMRQVVDSLIQKIGGAHAVLVSGHNNSYQGSNQMPPNKRPPADAVQRMDAENRGVSLATLYIDVPKEISNPRMGCVPAVPPPKASQVLPLTIPESLFPHPLDSRHHGGYDGVWGSDCHGCERSNGALVDLIRPTDAIGVSKKDLHVSQESVRNGAKNSFPRPVERVDVTLLTCGTWYKPGIITRLEFEHLPSILGSPPNEELQSYINEMVDTHILKYGQVTAGAVNETEDDAMREAYRIMSRARPKWGEYIDIRDRIVKFYREDFRRYLFLTDVKRQIAGDHSYLFRVFSLLEFFGVINLQATNVVGGMKGAGFRPVAQGIAKFASKQIPSRFSNLGKNAVENSRPVFVAVCDTCGRCQTRRVAYERNTNPHRYFCISCVASGEFPPTLTTDSFASIDINDANNSDADLLDNIHINVLDDQVANVNTWYKDTDTKGASEESSCMSMGRVFWESISKRAIKINEGADVLLEVDDLPPVVFEKESEQSVSQWIDNKPTDMKDEDALGPYKCALIFLLLPQICWTGSVK